MALHVLVLAGGSGSRLWPLSRGALPKHLLPLGPGGATLLRATVERLLPLGAEVRVVTIADQADACLRALEGTGLDRASLVAEPAPRGT
ncbi:MAG TPA: sugar phosphate nucleotidyltransferase, partial [Candidatus Dormibacteraeota bacterium]